MKFCSCCKFYRCCPHLTEVTGIPPAASSLLKPEALADIPGINTSSPNCKLLNAKHYYKLFYIKTILTYEGFDTKMYLINSSSIRIATSGVALPQIHARAHGADRAGRVRYTRRGRTTQGRECQGR